MGTLLLGREPWHTNLKNALSRRLRQPTWPTAIVAFLATNAGVALVMIAALYLDRQLPPLYRTNRWMFAAGVLSAAFLVAASCISGWGLIQQMLAT